MRWLRLDPINRLKQREEWHRWFAWHPVPVGDWIVWLEPVERKGTMFVGSACFWEWDYRDAPSRPRVPKAAEWTIEGSARAHAPYTCTLTADSSRMMHNAVSALRRDGFSRIVVTESAPTSPPQAPKVRSPE